MGLVKEALKFAVMFMIAMAIINFLPENIKKYVRA